MHFRKKAGKPVQVDWSKITKDKLTYLLLARDNFFRFYQFYANSAVALAISGNRKRRVEHAALAARSTHH